MSSYLVTGDTPDHIRTEINLHLQDITDRLDSIEGERGVFRRQYKIQTLQQNDKSPKVGGGDLFVTDNTEAVTLVDFYGGFNGHMIWIIIGDTNTTFDFVSGNLRAKNSNITSWTAIDTHLISAFYANGLWYCEVWDFAVTNPDGSSAGGGSTSKWQFTDISANYTALASDAFKIIRSTSASAVNVTIGSGVYELGDQITIYQKGAGTVTIVAGAGVTINTPTTLVVNEQYGSVTLVCEDTDEFFIAGRMSA